MTGLLFHLHWPDPEQRPWSSSTKGLSNDKTGLSGSSKNSRKMDLFSQSSSVLYSIPNLALFFDNLEKNWKEADFNWLWQVWVSLITKKKVRTCSGWGNIFWGGHWKWGVSEPKFCLKYVEFGIKWKKIKFWTLEVLFILPFYHLVKSYTWLTIFDGDS